MTSLYSEFTILPRRILLICVLFIFVGTGSRMVVLGLSRYLNQSAENSAVSGILDVSESKNIYPPKTVTPFRLYTYTPMHAWVVGSLLTPFKNSPLMTRVYLIRLSSLLFLVMTYILFWSFYLKPNQIKGSFFLLSLALSFSEFGNYALTGRNDFLALLFEISAGCFFLRWLDKKQTVFLFFFSLFCCCAFFTRQNSAGMILSGGIYLLGYRKFRELFWVSLCFACVLCLAGLGVKYFYPHLWMHSFKSHVGVWRSFYWSHPSSVLFFLSYSLFLVLGVRNCLRKDALPQVVFLKIFVLVSSVLSFILIHRHGAWLNYFFGTLLVLVFFCSRELKVLSELPRDSNYRKVSVGLIPIVSLVIFTVGVLRAWNQCVSPGFLDFSKGAESVRALAPQGGVSLGKWAQGLGVYLRDWEIIGPEILNGGHVGEANYENFKWVYDQLREKVKPNSAPALIYVNPQCAEAKAAANIITDPHLMEIMGSYQLKEVISSWLCLYGPSPELVSSQIKS